MKKIIIAIDGPAGSGKTTSAKYVAEKLGYIYIDTGAMYRAITLAWIRSGLDVDEMNAKQVVDNAKVELVPSENGQRTLLNGNDVSDEIRSLEVTELVSPVSAMTYVREKMVAQQREFGRNGGVVMDGRDIGTVVFPQAELKVYLIASIEARAERRCKELENIGISCSIEDMKQKIAKRDTYDSSRENSPLKKADDAIEIDTSNITITEQTNRIIDLAKSLINK